MKPAVYSLAVLITLPLLGCGGEPDTRSRQSALENQPNPAVLGTQNRPAGRVFGSPDWRQPGDPAAVGY